MDLPFFLSIQGLQRMAQHISRNVCSECLTIVASGTEVNARKYAGIFNFIERVGKAREKAGYTHHHIGSQAEGPVAKIVLQHRRGCAADTGMA